MSQLPRTWLCIAVFGLSVSPAVWAMDLEELTSKCTALRVKSPKLQTLTGFADYRLWKGLGFKSEAKYVDHEGDIQAGGAQVTLLRKKEKDTVTVPYGDLDDSSKQVLRYIVSLRHEVEADLRAAEEQQARSKTSGPPSGSPGTSPSGAASEAAVSEPPGPVLRLLDKTTFEAAIGTRSQERVLQDIAEALQAQEKVDLSELTTRLQQQLRAPERRGAYPAWLHTHADKLLDELTKFRSWKDATGTYATEARLVAVTPTSATLAKADGGRVPVPLAKLSRQSLNAIWALATCAAVLVDIQPALPDVARVEQIAQYCEAIAQSPQAAKELKSQALAWQQRAKPRAWGQIEGRYLGSGKHQDGSVWVALEKDDGQQVICYGQDLPAVCRSTLRQLEAAGDAILRAGERFALAQANTLAQTPPAVESPGPMSPDEPAGPMTPESPPAGTPQEKPSAETMPGEQPTEMTPEESLAESKPIASASDLPPSEESRRTILARVEAVMQKSTKLLPAQVQEALQGGEGLEERTVDGARGSFLKSQGYCKPGWEDRKPPVALDYLKLAAGQKAAFDLAANILETMLAWEQEADLRNYFFGFADDPESRDMSVTMALHILDQFGEGTVFLGLPYEGVASQARARLLTKFRANGWQPKPAQAPGNEPPPDAPAKTSAEPE